MSHIIISSILEVPVIYYESAILISGTYIMEEKDRQARLKTYIRKLMNLRIDLNDLNASRKP
jgi:hypothetical protein